MWKLRRPHLLQVTWDLECRLPNEVVPFVIVEFGEGRLIEWMKSCGRRESLQAPEDAPSVLWPNSLSVLKIFFADKMIKC